MKQKSRLVCEERECLPIPHECLTTHPQFVQSTYVPTDVDVSLLRNLLDKDQTVIQQNDQLITVLEERISTLRKKTSTLEGNLTLYRSALSACRRVPVEIWQLIFTFLCFSYNRHSLVIDQCELTGRMIYEMPTIALTHVCRKWRAIISGSPVLWSSISVELDLVGRDFREPLALHLKNSKGCGLNLLIQRKAGRRERWQFWRYGADLWEILCPHLQRCAILALQGDGYEALPTDRTVNLWHVRKLTLGATSRPIDKENWLWRAMGNVPHLTASKLFHAHQLALLPHSQLTGLAIHAFDAKDYHTGFPVNLLQDLARCKNMHSLYLKCSFHDHDGRNTLSPVQPQIKVILSRLTGMTIHDYTEGELDPLQSFFFSSITYAFPIFLPLETMSLRLHHMPNLDPSRYAVLSLLESLSGSLVEFKLTVTTRLKANGANGDYLDPFLVAILSKLNERSSEHEFTFLPKLKNLKLRLEGITVDAQTVELALDMLNNRGLHSYPLREFSLIRYTRQCDSGRPQQTVIPFELSYVSAREVKELEESFGPINIIIAEEIYK
ncbi:hypothetical protein AAF712_005830 [Marasmius tenuissimus]|uniref:F-box domain-containing protein n=1 Tax=Marasmius tenuissimus TaxID=585030 RepID=A0ABR2ZZK7_9AGAR